MPRGDGAALRPQAWRDRVARVRSNLGAQCARAATGWRCRNPAEPGHKFCRAHIEYAREQSAKHYRPKTRVVTIEELCRDLAGE